MAQLLVNTIRAPRAAEEKPMTDEAAQRAEMDLLLTQVEEYERDNDRQRAKVAALIEEKERLRADSHELLQFEAKQRIDWQRRHRDLQQRYEALEAALVAWRDSPHVVCWFDGEWVLRHPLGCPMRACSVQEAMPYTEPPNKDGWYITLGVGEDWGQVEVGDWLGLDRPPDARDRVAELAALLTPRNSHEPVL